MDITFFHNSVFLWDFGDGSGQGELFCEFVRTEVPKRVRVEAVLLTVDLINFFGALSVKYW